jgi:hypothetical protein
MTDSAVLSALTSLMHRQVCPEPRYTAAGEVFHRHGRECERIVALLDEGGMVRPSLWNTRIACTRHQQTAELLGDHDSALGAEIARLRAALVAALEAIEDVWDCAEGGYRPELVHDTCDNPDAWCTHDRLIHAYRQGVAASGHEPVLVVGRKALE